MDYEPIRKTVTKLVGTTFNNRQALLARVKAENLETIVLAREPSNMYDPEAITASVTFHDGTTEVIGHIQNSDRQICFWQINLIPSSRWKGKTKSSGQRALPVIPSSDSTSKICIFANVDALSLSAAD
jgi:hypothetical protein